MAYGYQHFGGNLTGDGGSRFLQNLRNSEAELDDFTFKMILIQFCRVLVMVCDISKYSTYFGLFPFCIVRYHIISYHIISYRITPHHIISYIISYVMLQKLALLPSSNANLSGGPSEIANSSH